MSDDAKSVQQDEQEVLEAGENPEVLESGDDQELLESGEELSSSEVTQVDDEDSDSDLPEGYEVLVSDDVSVGAQASQAEEFGETLVSVQNIIQRYSTQLDDVNSRLKDMREMMKNLMDNDPELQELSEQAKTATQDVKTRKQRIKESPESVELQMKSKELKEEQSELLETLNNHLLRYYQLTGSQVIEEPDGTEREFKVQARLKAKKSA